MKNLGDEPLMKLQDIHFQNTKNDIGFMVINLGQASKNNHGWCEIE